MLSIGTLALLAPLQLTAPLQPLPDGTVRASGPALAALDGRLELDFTGFSIPGFEARTVHLDRLPSATADAELWVDGEAVGRLHEALDSDQSIWRGSLEGSPGSDVYLALSSRGSRGWLRADGELWHLLAEPGADGTWSSSVSRWVDDRLVRDLIVEQPLCDTLEVPGRTTINEVPSPGTAPSYSGSTPVLFQARVAVETDYQYYQLFNDLTAAGDYMQALFAAMSDTYRADVGTRVDIAYLGLYTDNTDPWTSADDGGSSIDALYEFQAAWTSGWPVEADLAHYVSGANLGGGVAWVGVLGFADYAYSVSGNLAGLTPFPVAQGPLNWDFIVTSQETGHNFGTLHTHNYCPPIDECAPDGYWGECQTQAACVEGTIMSYCHLCDDGIANVRPEFHPTVKQFMRDIVVQSALRPYEGIETTDLGAQLSSASYAPTLDVAYDADTNEITSTGSDLPVGQGGIAVIGLQEASIPLFSGTLVPSPDLLVSFVPDGDPYTLAPATITGTFPDGVDLYFQHWVLEPSSADGIVATNGMRVTLFRPVPPSSTWTQHPTNGLEYALGEPATWWHSKSLAEQSGGTLAAIDSPELETWMVDNLFGGALPTEDYWIGMTDAFSEGSFYWLSGATGTYTKWGSGEPSDGGGFEDYAEWWQNGAEWNDSSGFDSQRAIYQRPIGTTP
ncbi:MAG: M12 family metallo-peptidase [Planctomycetota bacterium]|jgi:hypothetical protein